MGKKQREQTKKEQAEITLPIYYIPELNDLINRIIQEVYSRDYVKKVTQGRHSGAEIVHKAMDKPQQMYPRYLYLVHYFIRRKLHNTKEYDHFGFGLSTKQMIKRLGIDPGTMALMVALIDEEGPYPIITRTKNHSSHKRKKSARKYKLLPQWEELINEENKYILNRAEHGKMVENILKLNAKGRAFNEQMDANKIEFDADYNDEPGVKETL